MLKIENTSEYNKTTDWQVSKNLIEQRGIFNFQHPHFLLYRKLLKIICQITIPQAKAVCHGRVDLKCGKSGYLYG